MKYKFVFADINENRNIYAVAPNGDMFFYRDLFQNGQPKWAYDGVGQKIGHRWGLYRNVFSGTNGVIYAIAYSGEMYYYRDLDCNGTAFWENNGNGMRIHADRFNFRYEVSGGFGVYFKIDDTGNLIYNNIRSSTYNLKIGKEWGQYPKVFSSGNGNLYAVTDNGDLLVSTIVVHDQSRTFRWDVEGEKIGHGWGSTYTFSRVTVATFMG